MNSKTTAERYHSAVALSKKLCTPLKSVEKMNNRVGGGADGL